MGKAARRARGVAPWTESMVVLSIFPRPRVVRHHVSHSDWQGEALTIAILSDIHAARPWLGAARLRRIVAQVNGLGADLILLPGDFIADRKLPARALPADEIADCLRPLTAPLGVYAVLGNHDWFDCAMARANRFTDCAMIGALDRAGLPLLRNGAVRLDHRGSAFWLVGMDSQRPIQGRPRLGYHRPDQAFADVPPGAPAILMAHEPDYFADGDARAFLQISGHTHGGQVNLLGWRPVVPSLYGTRYVWGHVREGGRHLIVSGGVGCSGLPLRLLQPPEVTLVTVTRP